MNARYYLPHIGRFLSADTLVPDPANPQSFNRYSYVLNNPLRFTDPTGHCEHLSQQDVFDWHDSCLNWIENEYGVVIDSWLQVNIHLVWAIYKGLGIMRNEIGGVLFQEIYGNIKFIYTGGTGAISGSATTFSILFQGSSLKVFNERISLGIDAPITNLVTTVLHELSHFIVNRSSKDRGSEQFGSTSLGNKSTLSGYFPEVYKQFESLSGWSLGTIPNMATPYGRGIAEGRYPSLLFGDPPNKVNEDAAESLAVSLVANDHSLIRSLVQNQVDRWYLYNGGYNEPNH